MLLLVTWSRPASTERAPEEDEEEDEDEDELDEPDELDALDEEPDELADDDELPGESGRPPWTPPQPASKIRPLLNKNCLTKFTMPDTPLRFIVVNDPVGSAQVSIPC